MKTKLVKLIFAVLALTVLISALALTASAADEIVNLYDESKSLPGIATTKDGGANGDYHYHSAAAIEVTAGDKLTIGPVHENQGWVLTAFDENGNATVKNVKPASLKKTDVILNNAVILTYTVPKGTKYVRFVTSQMFYDSTLITKNYEFTKDEYFAYMDKAGVNVDYLRPTTAKNIKNLFPATSNPYAGRYDAGIPEGKVDTDTYRSSDLISVKSGDVIYFASALQSQGYHLSLFDANGKGIDNIAAKYMVLYEDLGDGYAIYSYRVRPDAAKFSAILRKGCFEDGISLVTVNQPFTGEAYREMFDIDKSSVADTESPLYGLKGLFMGDSISAGAGDTSISYKDPHTIKAWAGRIDAYTGLEATNASIGGAKASYINGDDTNKWLYNQLVPNAKKKFDVVVMQAGVNDARHERVIGKPMDIDTEEDVLRRRLTTYIGGLQWTFHNVKKAFPDATLFFIANHRLDGHKTGNAQNMGPYFDAAKALCEMYGIHFIDLYNNEELNTRLETHTTKYLPDTLHLNGEGYDILTPYIIEAMEEVMAAKAEAPETEAPTTEDPTTEAPTTEAPVTEAPTTEAPVTNAPETEAPVADSGCGATVSASVISVISLIALAGAHIGKKKE